MAFPLGCIVQQESQSGTRASIQYGSCVNLPHATTRSTARSITRPTTRSITRPTARPTARALARAAREALAQFGVSPRARIARLQDGENTTWKVTTLRPRRTLVLRLHRANYQSPTRIEAELRWLEALGRDLPGCAPTPIRSTAGAALQAVAVGGTDQTRPASLLTWTSGRFAAWPGSPRALGRLGALTAKLHVHGRAWRHAAKRQRPALAFEDHVGARCHWGIAPLDVPGLRKSQRTFLAKTLRDLAPRIDSWDNPRTKRGLIHGDLHLGNALIEGDVARAIDFDDCVRTWYLMDPAVTLLSAALHDGFDARRDAYWAGYASEGGTIPAGDAEQLASFQLVRFITMHAWSYTRRGNARIRAYHPKRQKLMLDACRVWHRTDGARIR
jgi:Ser/Thr protein kinase RdoA (MazF antagonist)